MRMMIGFVLGAAVGAGAALLLTPQDGAGNREWLRRKTDKLAAGESLPSGIVRKVRNAVAVQRARIDRAIEVGREATERQEKLLWAQLKLTPPSDGDSRPEEERKTLPESPPPAT